MIHLKRIDEYWATFLGCSVAQLNSTETFIFKTTHTSGISAIKRQAWVVAVGDQLPLQAGVEFAELACDQQLDDLQRENQLHSLCQSYNLENPYGPSILHYLNDTYQPPKTEIRIGSRLLRQDDEPALRAFKQKLDFSPEYTLCLPDHFPYALGCFDDGELVAIGTVRVWENTLAEIFIDTLLPYRSQGIGTYLGANVASWILSETDWIPQYDAEVTNGASLSVATRLGFRPYGHLFVTGSGLMITAS